MSEYEETEIGTKLGISYELEHYVKNDKISKVLPTLIIGVLILLVAIAVFICWKVVS